ncbi:MAG TPA: hypothetical protein VFM14_14045 [Gemmatimonadales bacterium]|nr:hypothetical protein [Gemmatimonadales bacterium]
MGTRAAALLWLVLLGCREHTGRLSPERESRFVAESVLHRADDVVFRYTEGGGRRGGRWEDRLASIVVTRQTVLIHKNEKVGLELTPRTRRDVEVRRDGNRLRITAGSGRTAESWSFVPADDAERWATDIRAVIRHRQSP